jgi:DNA helicase HerA-like ATPase
MLSELYENLPEIGDPEKPKLVFFFDEAHLLFTDAPQALMQKIELVIRLVRSKGVGVYFVTQNPLDVPDIVLGQLGNRIQHALRSFTPRDQKAVQAAAETFRTNAKLDVVKAITELSVGEALVSFLDPKGTPGVVERAYILPPHSQIGAITPEQRQAMISASIVFGQYEKTVDRESAHEILKGRAEGRVAATETSGGGMMDKVKGTLGDVFGEATGLPTGSDKKGGRTREGFGEAMIKSASRAIGSQIGRSIIRGVLGSILGGRGRF